MQENQDKNILNILIVKNIVLDLHDKLAVNVPCY